MDGVEGSGGGVQGLRFREVGGRDTAPGTEQISQRVSTPPSTKLRWVPPPTPQGILQVGVKSAKNRCEICSVPGPVPLPLTPPEPKPLQGSSVDGGSGKGGGARARGGGCKGFGSGGVSGRDTGTEQISQRVSYCRF